MWRFSTSAVLKPSAVLNVSFWSYFLSLSSFAVRPTEVNWSSKDIGYFVQSLFSPLRWIRRFFFFLFKTKQVIERRCPLVECTLRGNEWMLCIPVHCLTYSLRSPGLSLKSCVTLILHSLAITGRLEHFSNLTVWEVWFLAVNFQLNEGTCLNCLTFVWFTHLKLVWI